MLNLTSAVAMIIFGMEENHSLKTTKRIVKCVGRGNRLGRKVPLSFFIALQKKFI